jgi:hypothetical protein
VARDEILPTFRRNIHFLLAIFCFLIYYSRLILTVKLKTAHSSKISVNYTLLLLHVDPLLGNDSVNTFPRRRIRRQQVDDFRFYAAAL